MKKQLTIILMLLFLAGVTACNNSKQGEETDEEKSEEAKEDASPAESEFVDSTITCTVNGVTFKMLPVTGGTFMMGASGDSLASDDEKPAHKVTLSSYHIGETEVTQELWLAVMGSDSSEHTGDMQRPVDDVSWEECQEFIKKLNRLTGKHFRLPTEAEWEFAARGGNKSKGYLYAGSNTLDDVAWASEHIFDDEPHPVGMKAPNELGLYDMSGNVSEWCQDGCSEYSERSQTNPTVTASEKTGVVHRGGCNVRPGSYCRVSARDCEDRDERHSSIGLRLAL